MTFPINTLSVLKLDTLIMTITFSCQPSWWPADQQTDRKNIHVGHGKVGCFISWEPTTISSPAFIHVVSMTKISRKNVENEIFIYIICRTCLRFQIFSNLFCKALWSVLNWKQIIQCYLEEINLYTVAIYLFICLIIFKA